MNIQEACQLLDVPIGSSTEDVKKAFKKKAMEYHPDRNKSEGAEAKFKKINEAYQLLEKHGTNPPDPRNVASEFYTHDAHFAEELRRHMHFAFNQQNGFQFFNNFHGNPTRINSEPIVIHTEVPFEMSILGGKKEITFERTVVCKCPTSDIKNTCPKCDGRGYRTYGQDDKELPCNTCKTSGFINDVCPVCEGSGVKKIVDTLKVTIPPGVESGMRLVLNGRGNYIKLPPHIEQREMYGNVIVILHILADHDMQRSGDDVIGVVELSLLEALKGTKKKIRTVKGEKTLSFKPKMKNKDTIRVSGFGVPPEGAHVVVVNVSYPDDVSGIIETLECIQEPELEEISGTQD